MSTNKGDKDTLCWKCKKACGLCNWSAVGVPVYGWKAQEVNLRVSANKDTKSFLVLNCPQFELDLKTIKEKPRKIKSLKMKFEEIAKLLNINPRTCSSYYYKNKNILKKRLTKLNKLYLFEELEKEVYL